MPLTDKCLNFAKSLSYSELERVSKSHIPKFSKITKSYHIQNNINILSAENYQKR